jgi:phage regulator Rha-like protein
MPLTGEGGRGMGLPVTAERIDHTIRLIRGHRVMLDTDLAELYGVDVKQLKRQVRRNKERFPDDFFFELTKEEQRTLRSQSGTLKRGGHSKYRAYAFTEQGVAMLSGVLRGSRAVQVNVAIMRAFVRLREIIGSNKGLARRLAELEKKYDATFLCSRDAHERGCVTRMAGTIFISRACAPGIPLNITSVDAHQEGVSS